MQLVSLVIGIITFCGMMIFLIPFLGWANWLNVPLSVIGLVFGLIGTGNASGSRGIGMAGIALNMIAIIIGVLRLRIGCGII